MKSAEGSGRTVEEAIREALRILGARREDVDLVVLDEGSRGVLGLGARPAQVRLTLLSEMEEEAFAAQPADRAAAETGEGGDPVSAARSATSSIIAAMGFRAAINARQDADTVKVTVTGQQLAPLIGRRGQTLEALDLLVSLIVAHRLGHRVLLSVDVERYRERRREMLVALARRTAVRVRRTGEPVALEPMPASERRVIHTALAQEAGVRTHSEGDGAERHIIISPGESTQVAPPGADEDFDEADGSEGMPG